MTHEKLKKKFWDECVCDNMHHTVGVSGPTMWNWIETNILSNQDKDKEIKEFIMALRFAQQETIRRASQELLNKYY